MPPAFLRPHCLIRCPAPPFPHIRLMLEINNPGFRGSRWIQFQKCSSHGSSATSSTICKAGPSRRDVALLGCCYWASTAIVSSPGLHAATELDGDVKMALFVDDINAYSFLYPTELPGKKFSFKWVESRKPERYSSAAPLSPDARQRIVSERVDMINNLIISISIGPPNLGYLTSTDKKTWQAKDVADSVLSDKSALPVKTSQRRTESSVINAHANEVDGDVYWYYEYLVRKSPTKSVQESNIYRHNVASTAERDGYLYSFNASTLSKKWESLGPFLEKAVSSFRLLPPTEYYVPPFKDPWRFW
uniref:Photosystem II reaction center PsbP family protein n=1 Tax=Habenaria pantlingiana TaxID=1498489 RepID=A0A0F7GXJ1_9ASPA